MKALSKVINGHTIKGTVKKNSWGVWVARITRNNILISSYEGLDKQDAEQTLAHMFSDEQLGFLLGDK